MKDFADCDYIFLCTPTKKNIEYLQQLKDVISPDCIITDVGSVKSEIHREVIRLCLEANFIGGHPMAGSEKTGLSNASETLLENAYYIITPTTKSPSPAVEELTGLVRSLGAIPLVLGYEQHDYATAAISHLPHVIAYSLVNLVRESDDEYEIMKTHVTNSIEMIHFLPNMNYVIPAVLSHHERYDGKGYPRGLKGEDIPLLGRILAVCDSFDAMTTKRTYKEAMSIDYAISELEHNKGTQFDPKLAEAFIELLKEGKIEV